MDGLSIRGRRLSVGATSRAASAASGNMVTKTILGVMDYARLCRFWEAAAITGRRIARLELNAWLRERIGELERRLGLNSGNSGKPPSSAKAGSGRWTACPSVADGFPWASARNRKLPCGRPGKLFGAHLDPGEGVVKCQQRRRGGFPGRLFDSRRCRIARPCPKQDPGRLLARLARGYDRLLVEAMKFHESQPPLSPPRPGRPGSRSGARATTSPCA